MTVVDFMQYIGSRFSEEHWKSLKRPIERLLAIKGWNIIFIILLIPLLILCIGYFSFLLTLEGISLGIAFLLNGILSFIFKELSYDYDKGKFYIEWILAILVAFSSIPLFFITIQQVFNGGE